MLSKFRKLCAAGALFALAALSSSPSFAAQGSGCMPTTGTVSGLTLVQDINAGIAALISSNSGASAPATDCTAVAIKGQLWLDTTVSTASILKVYTGTTWLQIGTVDVTNGIWTPPTGGGTQSIASASTTNICTAPQTFVTITGVVTITSFGSSCSPGQSRDIQFAGALTLTYNATSMVLPTAANISTAAGDYARAIYLGGGNWAVVRYTKADGTSLANTAIFTGAVFYNSVISPTALASSTNNWNPASLATTNTIRFSCSSAINITGITAPVTDGKILILDNIGSTNACTLTTQDANSTAGNRFALTAPYAVLPLTQVVLRYDLTTARWKLWTEIPAQPVAGGRKNLRVYNAANALGDAAPGTPNNQMNVKAEGLTVEDINGTTKRLRTVSCTTLDITNSGANGLDTGAVSAPNWYSVWVIFNPSTNTTACMFSASSTLGTITLPSGYTFGVRVGWNYYVTFNAVTGLRRLIQYDNFAQYVLTSGSNTNILPVVASGTAGTFSNTAPTWSSAVSLATIVPSTATAISLVVTFNYKAAGAADVYVAPNNSYGGYLNATGLVPSIVNLTQSGTQGQATGWIQLETQNLFWVSDAAGGAMLGFGWRDNL